MRNLIKISLITSIILSTNLLAWSEAETETRVNSNQTQLNGQQLRIDDLDEYKLDKTEFYPTRDLAINNETRLDNKDIVDNQQTSDITELFNRTNTNQSNYTTLQDQVNNIESQSYATEEYVDDLISDVDDEIYGYENVTTTTNAQGETIETTTDVEGTIYEILNGQTEVVYNVDKGEVVSETTIKKGLIELSEENIVKDTEQDTAIANNNTLANSAFINANNAQNKADVNSSDITSIKSINNNQNTKIDNNIAKNTAQDIVINQAVNDINIEKTRNDNQDVQISNIDNRVTINADKDIAQDVQISSINSINVSQQTEIDNNTSKNTAQDVVINQAVNDINIEKTRNDNQDIKIDNNTSKNTAQDTQISNLDTRVTKVEDDVVILINNSNQQNSQDINRVENKADKNSQDIKEMKKEFSKIDKRENKKIASSNASNLEHYFLEGDNTSVTVKASNFNGESAIGMGIAYRDKNRKTVYSLGYGTDGENHSVNVKASFSFSL